MKTLRIFGSVFVVLGLFFALIGILTSIFPMIENDQFKLILKSFEETSADSLTNTLNAIVRFCLHSSYFLLFSGIALMVTGGLLSSAANKKQLAAGSNPEPRADAASAYEVNGVPKPAYYPGGMAPPVFTYQTGKEADTLFADADEPLNFGTAAAPTAGPISGGIAPSFSADESDAQRLMQNDQQIASRIVTERPLGEDYAKYLSNEKSQDEPKDDGDLFAAAPGYASGTPGSKPRIVSTMGKRKQ